MAKIILLTSVLAVIGSAAVVQHAHSGSQSNLRAPSNSPAVVSFSQGIWNNTITNLIQHEIQMPKARSTGVNKWLYVLCCMILGYCGVDRCFMGQVCLGCLKGFTLGGFMIWHFIDYFVCIYCALTKSPDIKMVGYDATFDPKTIDTAFYLCAILIIWDLFQSSQKVSQARAQMKLQQEELEKMNNPDVPMRHASLAYMPTMFTATMRKAGVVTETPTVPELIAAFDQMDTNGDGLLDHDEIKVGLKAMGASDDTVDEMIKSADKDADGKINQLEFLAAMAKKE